MTIELLVERDQLKKRIEELEETVAKQDDHLRQACDEVTRCHARIHELVDELAPVRALKVGSWEWAMFQMLLKNTVANAVGHQFKMNESDGLHMCVVGGKTWEFVPHMQRVEPFTLHVEPEPEPTAAELAAAIERFRRGPQGLLSVKEFDEMVALAARVKRKEGGDGR